jgi:hypothetical protein
MTEKQKKARTASKAKKVAEAKKKPSTSVPTGVQPPAKDKPKQKRRPRITAADYGLCVAAVDLMIDQEKARAVEWAKDHLVQNGAPFSGDYSGLQAYCAEQGVSIGASTTLVKAEALKAKLQQYT